MTLSYRDTPCKREVNWPRNPSHKVNLKRLFSAERWMQKVEVKSAIGRSPDFSDALAMRMYYELKPQGVYYVQ